MYLTTNAHTIMCKCVQYIICTIFLHRNAQFNFQYMYVYCDTHTIKLWLNHIHKHTSIRLINEQMKKREKTRSSGAYEAWSNFKCVCVNGKCVCCILKETDKMIAINEAVDKRIQKHNYIHTRTHAHTHIHLCIHIAKSIHWKWDSRCEQAENTSQARFRFCHLFSFSY